MILTEEALMSSHPASVGATINTSVRTFAPPDVYLVSPGKVVLLQPGIHYIWTANEDQLNSPGGTLRILSLPGSSTDCINIQGKLTAKTRALHIRGVPYSPEMYELWLDTLVVRAQMLRKLIDGSFRISLPQYLMKPQLLRAVQKQFKQAIDDAQS